MVNDAEARRMATRAEQDLNTYQAKQGLGPQSDSSMSKPFIVINGVI